MQTEIMLLKAPRAADMQTIRKCPAFRETCVILHKNVQRREEKQIDGHNEPDLADTVTILSTG